MRSHNVISNAVSATMDNIYAYAWIGNAHVYGVVHGVSGYYPCNAKINDGSWLKKIVWS